MKTKLTPNQQELLTELRPLNNDSDIKPEQNKRRLAIIKQLIKSGMSYHYIGLNSGISRQRIHQILIR